MLKFKQGIDTQKAELHLVEYYIQRKHVPFVVSKLKEFAEEEASRLISKVNPIDLFDREKLLTLKKELEVIFTYSGDNIFEPIGLSSNWLKENRYEFLNVFEDLFEKSSLTEKEEELAEEAFYYFFTKAKEELILQSPGGKKFFDIQEILRVDHSYGAVFSNVLNITEDLNYLISSYFYDWYMDRFHNILDYKNHIRNVADSVKAEALFLKAVRSDFYTEEERERYYNKIISDIHGENTMKGIFVDRKFLRKLCEEVDKYYQERKFKKWSKK